MLRYQNMMGHFSVCTIMKDTANDRETKQFLVKNDTNNKQDLSKR